MVKLDFKGEPFKILLVEDNQDHADLIMLSLAKNRVANKITHIHDGEQALDYLYGRGDFTDAEKYPLPHLILLDLRMPKIDGLSVLSEIKSDNELKAIPVVILTTSNAEKDVAKAYELHANSYVVKPLDFKAFTALMSELGFYWLGWNRSPFG